MCMMHTNMPRHNQTMRVNALATCQHRQALRCSCRPTLYSVNDEKTSKPPKLSLNLGLDSAVRQVLHHHLHCGSVIDQVPLTQVLVGGVQEGAHLLLTQTLQLVAYRRLDL